MKKSSISALFLACLTAFPLCSCEKEEIIKELSNEEVKIVGEFEKGTDFKTKKIESTSEDYRSVLEKIKPETFNENKLAIYEFSLEKNGEKIEPTKPVSITIPKPFETEKGYKTIHIKNDDTTETLNTTLSGMNITFTTSSFSTFIISEKTSLPPIVNPTYNFKAYADTSTQGKIIVNKEEKTAYCDELNIDDEVYLVAVPNEGYEFMGWYKGSKLSKNDEKYVDFKDEAYFKFDGKSIEIYARFMPIEYSITYDLNGGKLNNNDKNIPSTYTIETDTINLPTPVKDYYKFNGWSNGKEIVTSILKGSMGDIKLSATWTQTIGIPRTIEIINDIGEIEQGAEEILSVDDYILIQENKTIAGKDIDSVYGNVIIEYKKANETESSYVTTIPNELGEYMVRVRITQSKTDPYYASAISNTKSFTMVKAVIKTSINVINNYIYDKYKVGNDKVRIVSVGGQNVMLFNDINGGDTTVTAYRGTKGYAIYTMLLEPYHEKYAEVRVGGLDGVVIARLRLYYGISESIDGFYDENEYYQNKKYYPLYLQGGSDDPFLTTVYFELVPNVSGYTDAEGKWICPKKSIDVCTYADYSNEGKSIDTSSGFFAGGGFELSRYNGYKDLKEEGIYTQVRIGENKIENNLERLYGRVNILYSKDEIRKYDIITSGNVELYLFDHDKGKYEVIKTSSFMTLNYPSGNTSSIDLQFVLHPGASIKIYNGKYSELCTNSY